MDSGHGKVDFLSAIIAYLIHTNVKPPNNVTYKTIQQNHAVYNIIVTMINSKVHS